LAWFEYAFVVISITVSVFYFLIYAIIPFKIPLDHPFIRGQWALFFVGAICNMGYQILFAFDQLTGVMITLWAIGFCVYSVGHFLFSWQYYNSAAEIKTQTMTSAQSQEA
jgi:hypothetical protein